MDRAFTLKHPFPCLILGDRSYYGGDQRWLEKPHARKVGCGVICAANILLYLALYAEGCKAGPFGELARQEPVSATDFACRCDDLQRRYLPVMPRFGLTGLQLAFGLNCYFRRYRLPYRMSWQLKGRGFWQSIQNMLQQDIPVTLAIGPNFPVFWGRHKLRFYRWQQEAGFRPATATKAHFVTVTAMDEEWLRISSWGREYYIDRQEYEDYVRRHSTYLTSNIGLVRRV